jgi:hypothetical protein
MLGRKLRDFRSFELHATHERWNHDVYLRYIYSVTSWLLQSISDSQSTLESHQFNLPFPFTNDVIVTPRQNHLAVALNT